MNANKSMTATSHDPAVQIFLSTHSDEYFYCEREKCIMRKISCLLYQEQAKTKAIGDYAVRFFGGKSLKACERANCWGCEQGMRIKNGA